MRRTIANVCAVLLAAGILSAQGAPKATAQAATGGGLTISPPPPQPPVKPLEFPIGEGVGRGDILTMKVKIKGKEYLFMVDTGSQYTILDSTLAAPSSGILGEPVDKIQATSAYGGKSDFPLFRRPRIEAARRILESDGSDVMVTDLHLVREASGRPIEGILGADILSQYVVRLDFRTHVLQLIDSPDYSPPEKQGVHAFKMVDTPSKGPGIAAAFVGLPELPVTLDTGSNVVGAISRESLRKIPQAEVSMLDSGQAWDAGGISEQKDLRIKRKWSLAGTEFENTPLQVAAFNLLGLGTLANFVITLDYPGHRVYLERIHEHHEFRPPPPIEFGIGLKDGRVLVYELGRGANALDIQVDDEILKVDGEDASKIELWALRERLGWSAKSVIRLQRKGVTHEVTLRQVFKPPTTRP